MIGFRLNRHLRIEKIRAFILLTAIFLNGCVPVKKPRPNQIEGTWEHISLLYLRMELDKNA